MKRIDRSVLLPALVLSLTGLLMIYSTGGNLYLLRQSLWLAVSVCTAVAFANIHPRAYAALSPYLYATSLLLLAVLFVLPVGYPHRWLKYGFVSLQPSEFAKIGSITFLAMYLAKQKRLGGFSDIIVPLVIMSAPAALVFIEPDFGASQVFFPMLLAMLYWAGMPAATLIIFFSPLLSAVFSFSIPVWIAFMIPFAVFLVYRRKLVEMVYGFIANPLAGLLTPLAWGVLKPYQQKRIVSFLSPWLDPQGISWQIIQSKIAIGSGRLFGKGFLSGTQKKLEFLPERHTDFIFSCIGEEFGFVGTVAMIVAYVFLLLALVRLASAAKNRFSSLCIIGIVGWFGYQAFLNMGMTMGLLPITGVPLPFVSYGGSALLACFMAIGLALSVAKVKYEY